MGIPQSERQEETSECAVHGSTQGETVVEDIGEQDSDKNSETGMGPSGKTMAAHLANAHRTSA